MEWRIQCACHGQDISHKDNLSQPADAPGAKHAHRKWPYICALPLPHMTLLCYMQLINKFINGL